MEQPVNDVIATLSVIVYSATLYPGFSRELFPRQKIQLLGKYRKEIGVTSCLIGCVHAIYSYYLSTTKYPHLGLWTSFHLYISGIVCLAVFVSLGITSNRWIQKILKKNWRRLHTLTYLLPGLLIWHIVVKVTAWSLLTQVCFLLLISATSLLILRFSKRVFPNSY